MSCPPSCPSLLVSNVCRAGRPEADIAVVRCSAILTCLIYMFLLFARKEQGRRVNWWFYRMVPRPKGRTVIVK